MIRAANPGTCCWRTVHGPLRRLIECAGRLVLISLAAFPMRSGMAQVADVPRDLPTTTRERGLEVEDIAREIVARHLKVEAAAVRILSVEARDFPDSALGCRVPGMAYLQVITPGFVVQAEADGRRFDVRVAGQRGRICHARKPAPDRTDLHAMREAARQDLSRRLGVAVADVSIAGMHRLKPGESLPGCGTVCASDAPVCGYGVQLRVADRGYAYLALDTGVRPCPDIASR